MLETLHRRKGAFLSCAMLLLLTGAAVHVFIMASIHVRDHIREEIRQAVLNLEDIHEQMTNKSGDSFQLKNVATPSCHKSSKNGQESGASKKRKPRERTVATVLLPSICANENCRTAYVGHFQKEDVYPIPAIRHVLWKSDTVSMYFAEQLRSWQKIHPDWTYVLWRDQDMEPFVATFFPGLLAKFKSLPAHIMRVDMIRYMLMFKYGGVYADLDYTLLKSLDIHRRFHAVVTREPDAHSLQFQDMSWPVKIFASPAFLMCAPGHVFFFYTIQQLLNAQASSDQIINFAGPTGLTHMLESYTALYPITADPMAAVYVPPSYSFYPYKDNRLSSSKTDTNEHRFMGLRERCKTLLTSDDPRMQQLRTVRQLTQFCIDVNNLDPITDKTQPVFAIHDLQKAGGVWYGKEGHGFYTNNVTQIRSVLKNVTFGIDFMRVYEGAYKR